MAKADDGKDLAVGLEILPGRRWRPTEYELEAEGTRCPRLIREWRLLVLGIEGADGVEGDCVMAEEHGGVVPEKKRRDAGDRKNRHPDHAARFDASVGFHFSDE